MRHPLVPPIILSFLVVLGYIYTLSQTTFYYEGEDGAGHIWHLWFEYSFLYYLLVVTIYWVTKIIPYFCPAINFKQKPNFLRYILSLALSVVFIIFLTLLGFFMLKLHYTNAYWSESEFDPNFHLQPIYYLHILPYVASIFSFDWLVNKIFLYHRKKNQNDSKK